MSTVNANAGSINSAKQGIEKFASTAESIVRHDGQALEDAHTELLNAIRILERNIASLTEQLRKAKDLAQRARSLLSKCQQARDTDCSGLASQVRQADEVVESLARRLRQEEDRLRYGQQLERQLAAAISVYARQASRLQGIIQHDIPKASAFLRDRIAAIAGFEAGQLFSGSGRGELAGYGHPGWTHKIPPQDIGPHLFGYAIRGSLFGIDVAGHAPSGSDPRVGVDLGFHAVKADVTLARGSAAVAGEAFLGAKVAANAGMKIGQSTAMLNLSLDTFVGARFTPQAAVVAGHAASIDGLFGAKWGLGGKLDLNVGFENGAPVFRLG